MGAAALQLALRTEPENIEKPQGLATVIAFPQASINAGQQHLSGLSDLLKSDLRYASFDSGRFIAFASRVYTHYEISGGRNPKLFMGSLEGPSVLEIIAITQKHQTANRLEFAIQTKDLVSGAIGLLNLTLDSKAHSLVEWQGPKGEQCYGWRDNNSREGTSGFFCFSQSR